MWRMSMFRRLCPVALVVASAVVFTEPAVSTAAGFDTDGVVVDTGIGGSRRASVRSVAEGSGGSLVVGGEVQTAVPGVVRGFVARYLVSGERDPSFGSNGLAVLPSTQFPVTDVALLGDGSVLLLGSLGPFSTVRLLAADGRSSRSLGDLSEVGNGGRGLVSTPDGGAVFFESDGSGSARRVSAGGVLSPSVRLAAVSGRRGERSAWGGAVDVGFGGGFVPFG
jgi:hypothetical protein